MLQTHNIEKGLFFQRQTRGGFMFVGFGFLPPAVALREGASYVMVNKDGRSRTIPFPVDTVGPEGYQMLTINDWVREPVWANTDHSLTTMYRCFEAQPEKGGYILFGASQQPIFAEVEAGREERWFEVSEGAIQEREAPFQTQGLQLGQIGSHAPVWPDRDGNLYAFDHMGQYALDKYRFLHQVQLEVFRKELTLEQGDRLLKADPLSGYYADSLRSHAKDEDYLKFLSALEQEGFLERTLLTPEAEFRSREACASTLMKALLQEQEAPDTPANSSNASEPAPGF